MDQKTKLQVLKLRLEADLVEANAKFIASPDMETLNTLGNVLQRKAVFEQLVRSEAPENEEQQKSEEVTEQVSESNETNDNQNS